MRTLQRRSLRIKIMSKEILCEMLILFQIDVVAKIFDPDPWNFYTKNRSLSALWIFFQNYFCIFRSRMASFSYIYFGMKHHVSGKWKSSQRWTKFIFGPFNECYRGKKSFGVFTCISQVRINQSLKKIGRIIKALQIFQRSTQTAPL